MALFQAEEYLDRIRKTKQRMTDAGIDVLIVSDPANMNYLTGYDGWSFYVHQGIIVALDAQEPFWFGHRVQGEARRVLPRHRGPPLRRQSGFSAAAAQAP